MNSSSNRWYNKNITRGEAEELLKKEVLKVLIIIIIVLDFFLGLFIQLCFTRKTALALAFTIPMTFSTMLLLHDAMHFAVPACQQRHNGILQS